MSRAAYCACIGQTLGEPCARCAERDAQPLRSWWSGRPGGLMRAGHIRGRAFLLYLRSKRQGRAQVAAAAHRIFRQADARLQTIPLGGRRGVLAMSRPIPGPIPGGSCG